MGGVQGQKIHLKIRQDDLAVHVGRHGGGRVPRRRELNVHLGGRRRLLRPLSPWRPPPPPGAEELAGKPADWRADDPAGGTAREALGSHALGNLQAPASPRRAARTGRLMYRQVGSQLPPAKPRAGCDSAPPAPFSGSESGRGGESR